MPSTVWVLTLRRGPLSCSTCRCTGRHILSEIRFILQDHTCAPKTIHLNLQRVPRGLLRSKIAGRLHSLACSQDTPMMYCNSTGPWYYILASVISFKTVIVVLSRYNSYGPVCTHPLTCIWRHGIQPTTKTRAREILLCVWPHSIVSGIYSRERPVV